MEWCRRPIRLNLFYEKAMLLTWICVFMLNCFSPVWPSHYTVRCMLHIWFSALRKSKLHAALAVLWSKRGAKKDQILVPKLNTCLDTMFVTNGCLCTPIHRGMIRMALSAIQVLQVRATINSPPFAGVDTSASRFLCAPQPVCGQEL